MGRSSNRQPSIFDFFREVLIATTIFESGRIIQSRLIDRDKAERSLPLLILVIIMKNRLRNKS